MINEEQLKKVFIEIGAIDELEGFIENDELVSNCAIIDTKKVRECNHEQKNINLNYDYIKKDKGNQEKIKNIEDYLKENLSYNYLVTKNTDEFKANIFDRIYRIILEVLTNYAKTVIINGNNLSADIVRAVFKKLDYEVIESVIFKLQRLNNTIKNFKNYIITAVYNTYLEYKFQMQNQLYINE